jgi:hypothetical protein
MYTLMPTKSSGAPMIFISASVNFGASFLADFKDASSYRLQHRTQGMHVSVRANSCVRLEQMTLWNVSPCRPPCRRAGAGMAESRIMHDAD